MATYFAKKEEQKPRWFLIDAGGKVLGKVAVRAAGLLRGKGKSTFTAHVDTGDFVVVVNAEKVVLTGKKETGKKYMKVSGFPGGEKIESAKQIRAGRNPGRLVEHAVRGMIPHNRLGRKAITKLKVYAGPTHPHAAQQPQAVTL
jgi:large subunit ribosomal protein L13